MGFNDLISRIPSGTALNPSQCDEKFVVAKINKTKRVIYPSDNQKHSAMRLVRFRKTPITQEYIITF